MTAAIGIEFATILLARALDLGARRVRWKHGLYSAGVLAEQKRARQLLTQSRELLKQMQAG